MHNFLVDGGGGGGSFSERMGARVISLVNTFWLKIIWMAQTIIFLENCVMLPVIQVLSIPVTAIGGSLCCGGSLGGPRSLTWGYV